MGMAGTGGAKRPWVRWAGLAVFVIVLGVVFVRLGEWQLDRLAQRKANNAIVEAHESAPIVDYEQVFTPDTTITDLDQWQRVRISGTFDTEHQFQIRYRTNDGARGVEVVTPLRTASGDVVLVDRGFLETNTSVVAQIPPAPTGTVTVIGHVRRSEQGSAEAITPVDGMMRLINAPAISESLGYEVADGYIGLLEITPAQAGDLRPVALPTLDEGPHFWYAVQWFMFAAIAAAGLFVFIRNDVRDLRRRRTAPSSGSATPAQDATDVTEAAGSAATRP
ncbi:SURF1 family protein [Propionicicella superfundia]|uniref:SURF1 family cytochrome oxidase biogenesis protein n=1 Tax=Propionicicella superfundia TaxID=348582 RepID=UPI000428704F|nr:SURF1 family protein [Propionicicella superfundia]